MPAAALLLGAALAPTDPVLASDVQVGEPTDEEDSEDEVRFALTSEAGLNDGLAFPFVYAAIAMAMTARRRAAGRPSGSPSTCSTRASSGCCGGLLIGWLLGKLFFRAPDRELRLARHSEGFLALAATFLAYGLVEVAGGYGFLAVFVAARAIRAAERSHEFHQVLHDFAEQIERLLTVMLLLLFGGAVVGGLLGAADLAGGGGRAGPGVRDPAADRLAVAARRARPAGRALGHRVVRHPRHRLVLLPGVRDDARRLPQGDLLWATVGLVVLVSVVVHGVAATPVMQLLDREGERTEDERD